MLCSVFWEYTLSSVMRIMLKEDNQAVWNFLKMADILPEVVLVQCTHFMSLSFFLKSLDIFSVVTRF